MSNISFKCPHCGADLLVDERAWGNRVRCANCNRPINLTGPKPKSFLGGVSDAVNSFWKQNQVGIKYVGRELLRSIFGG